MFGSVTYKLLALSFFLPLSGHSLDGTQVDNQPIRFQYDAQVYNKANERDPSNSTIIYLLSKMDIPDIVISKKFTGKFDINGDGNVDAADDIFKNGNWVMVRAPQPAGIGLSLVAAADSISSVANYRKININKLKMSIAVAEVNGAYSSSVNVADIIEVNPLVLQIKMPTNDNRNVVLRWSDSTGANLDRFYRSSAGLSHDIIFPFYSERADYAGAKAENTIAMVARASVRQLGTIPGGSYQFVNNHIRDRGRGDGSVRFEYLKYDGGDHDLWSQSAYVVYEPIMLGPLDIVAFKKRVIDPIDVADPAQWDNIFDKQYTNTFTLEIKFP